MMFTEVKENHIITVLVFLLKLHYSTCMLLHVIIYFLSKDINSKDIETRPFSAKQDISPEQLS